MRITCISKMNTLSISRHIIQQHKRTFMTYQNRSAEVQNFFRHIEDKYGNLSHLIDKGKAAETIVAEDGILHPQHLTRLFQHDATALHVKGFYHKASALKLGEELIQESIHHSNNWKVSTSRGLESSDVATLGKHSPYNVAVARDQHSNSGHGKEEYFNGVKHEFISRRKSSTFNKDYKANYYQLWPLDKLRLELEESWSYGAGLSREETKQHHDHTRPFGGGLPRIMRGPTRWKRGFIHVDELGPLDTNRGLFSANIYLNMPPDNESDGKKDEKDKLEDYIRDSGGLYVWPLGVRSRLDWYRNAMTLSSLSAQDPQMQLNLQHVLGKPNVIHPDPGDLVLICAQRPHCAVGFNKGIRVSLQCFLQYSGLDKRLLIDC